MEIFADVDVDCGRGRTTSATDAMLYTNAFLPAPRIHPIRPVSLEGLALFQDQVDTARADVRVALDCWGVEANALSRDIAYHHYHDMHLQIQSARIAVFELHIVSLIYMFILSQPSTPRVCSFCHFRASPGQMVLAAKTILTIESLADKAILSNDEQPLSSSYNPALSHESYWASLLEPSGKPYSVASIPSLKPSSPKTNMYIIAQSNP